MSSGRVMNDVDTLISKKLEASGIIVVNNVKPRTAVDTGRLRASITHDSGETSVRVGSNVEYAGFLELGTSKMAAQPYLVPGLKASGGQLDAVWNS